MAHRSTTPRALNVLALVCTVLAVASFASAAAKKDKRQQELGPDPTTRIEVAPLGFVAPSRFYMVARIPSATLDFIDNTHLLFTFREAGLLHRLPGDPVDDNDQSVRALVIDLSSGKVAQQTQWRMHDRQRYLWSIGNGNFLVRQRDSLYRTDSNLELQPYLQVDTHLQGVAVSPDRKLMTVEFEKFDPLPAVAEPEPEAAPADPPISRARRKSTQILVIRTSDNKVIARSEASRFVDMAIVNDGFLEVLEGKQPDRWLIRNKPFKSESSPVLEVKSACDPSLITLSATVGLEMGCLGGSDDRSILAFSTKGSVLWQDRWQPRYIWPTFDFAENGTRFAYGSLQLTHSFGNLDGFGEEDVVAQMVGVLDTESGKIQLVKAATPILSAGRNYALSADGDRFAILRDGAIEIYDLPPASSQPATLASAAPAK